MYTGLISCCKTEPFLGTDTSRGNCVVTTYKFTRDTHRTLATRTFIRVLCVHVRVARVRVQGVGANARCRSSVYGIF